MFLFFWPILKEEERHRNSLFLGATPNVKACFMATMDLETMMLLLGNVVLVNVMIECGSNQTTLISRRKGTNVNVLISSGRFIWEWEGLVVDFDGSWSEIWVHEVIGVKKRRRTIGNF